MTDPTAPTPPNQPAVTPQQPATTPTSAMPLPGVPVAAKQSHARAWAVGGLALVIALCCGGVGIAALSDGDSEQGVNAAASSAMPSLTTAPAGVATTTAPPSTAPASTAPAVPTYDAPTKSDFKLKVKILRKQCFGSAGCNITYRIDVTYSGAGLDPSTTYEVTYEVKGAEDPIINTFEVTGDSASVQEEEMASTKRSADKLTAVVTSVSEL
ncbi:hypothetical protein ABZ807_24385 [Micromonospora sp. NPDC047548]|uniref:hypothetical protein n=1 Tax=Micromonospora sp. NPDC047548 TaxID=3155624 RepID=UPI0033E26E38